MPKDELLKWAKKIEKKYLQELRDIELYSGTFEGIGAEVFQASLKDLRCIQAVINMIENRDE